MTTKTTSSPWAETVRGKPEPGTAASRSRQTSMADIVRFTEMTGDRNPIHYDAALSGATRLGGLVVQGGVTTGLLNAVVAEDLPGPGTVFLETNWRFLKAVKVGETITATVRVIETRDDKPICRLETSISDSNGDVCVSGTVVTFTIPLHLNTDDAMGETEATG